MGTILEMPGVSVLGVDPGGTTGWAAYDGWTGRLFYDQWIGKEPQDTNLTYKKVPTKVRYSEMIDREIMVSRRLLELVWCLGPRTVIAWEDFVLGHNDGGKGGYGGREGLSPVRIYVSFMTLADEYGLWDGEMWLQRPAGIGGIDPRGFVVDDVGADYWGGGQGLDWRWRVRGRMPAQGVAGLGRSSVVPAIEMQMPSCKAVATDERLKAWGLWVPSGAGSHAHACDGMRHLVYRARELGLRIKAEPERFRAIQKEARDR